MKKFLYLSIILISCQQTKDKAQHMRTVEIHTPDNVFSSYRSEPSDGGSGMTLYEDSVYTFGYGSCLVSGSDSGKFSIRADTLYFKSLVEDKVDTSNHGHDQIRPLTGEKYLIRNGRIYHWYENGKYDMSSFWLRDDLETQPHEMLDSTGEGYTILYNGNRQITKRGFFKNFKLYDGEVYFYIPDGELRKIEIYKHGLKIKDSIPDPEQ